MENKLELAAGIWNEYDCDNADFVLVLPDAGTELGIRIREVFIKKLNIRRGVVFEGRQAEALISLYSLYAFTDKLIIGSFDFPYGRKLRNLLSGGAATEDELIGDVILGEM